MNNQKQTDICFPPKVGELWKSTTYNTITLRSYYNEDGMEVDPNWFEDTRPLGPRLKTPCCLMIVDVMKSTWRIPREDVYHIKALCEDKVGWLVGFYKEEWLSYFDKMTNE